MREIKFRAWDKRGNCFIYSDEESDYHKLSNFFSYTDDFPENYIIEQYTGLKDKNGVEIYENDICKYYQPYSEEWHTHIVKWDGMLACFGMFEKDNKWCKESDWIKIQEIEVIGNIHENSELLKEA